MIETEEVGGMRCVDDACMTSSMLTPRQHLEFENDYIIMLCRCNNQLRASSYANFPYDSLTGAQLLPYRTAIGS